MPVLLRRHPDGNFAIGRDCGIYWNPTDPPLKGVTVPDWFYVPDVPPTLDGHYRRSYVMWKELVAPLIVLEFASGNGSEERDRTPYSGKFWVYETVIRPIYYGIYQVEPGEIEMYEHHRGKFRPMTPNDRGHFPIEELGVELGVWFGTVENFEFPWMRWFDAGGILLPSGWENSAAEARRAEAESGRANAEAQRAERLAAQLRALGVEPDA